MEPKRALSTLTAAIALVLVAAPTAAAPPLDAVSCMGLVMAISQRPDGTLVLTKRRRQSKVYVFLVNRRCLVGTRDSYRWPGYRTP